VRIGAQAIATGLADVRWPGRLERIEVDGHAVIIDAAHNPAGARALASYLSQTVRGPITLLFAAMRDKAVADMLAILAPAIAGIICTTAPSPRAMPASDIAALARHVHGHVSSIDDPMAAFDHALRRDGTTVIAGSIFLIGPLRERVYRGILR
jgi:dihydrofolate synthase / folylpolyglutamate synthase